MAKIKLDVFGYEWVLFIETIYPCSKSKRDLIFGFRKTQNDSQRRRIKIYLLIKFSSIMHNAAVICDPISEIRKQSIASGCTA